MADQFRAMQRVTLGVQKNNGDYDFYPSMVLDFEEDRNVKAAVPTHHGREILVRPETPVLLDVAAGAAVMRYHTTVIERSEAPLGLTLRWPKASERVQRRNHFRVEVRVPVEFKVIGGEAGPAKRGKGTTMDLSAGGVRLRLEDALPEGTTIGMEIEIRRGDTLDMVGRVVRSGEIPGASVADRFWNGVVFQGTTELANREINRFVMDVQREQMRKGGL